MKEFILLLPEIYLGITILGLLVGEIGYHGERVRLLTFTSVLGLSGALIQVLLTYPYCPQWAMGETLAIDGLALFFKILILLMSLQTIFSLHHSREINKNHQVEYYVFVLGAALAMCLAASSANLLVGFLALQLLQIIFTLLSAFKKDSVLSIEASLKLWSFGLVSAFLFLFGIALVMIWTQSLNIHEIRQVLISTPIFGAGGWIVFTLIFLSLSFQLGVFPMHLWVPDVLEGAPTPVSAFISLGSCTAALAFGLRFFLELFSQPSLELGGGRVLGDVDWPQFLAVVSGITLFIGPLLAFRQEGVKRLLACLMISEGGFLLLGLLVLDQAGIQAILYCILVEIFCAMGAFYIISFFYDEFGSDRLSHLRGSLKNAVPESIALLLFLACLIGLPPFPGFIGKFALIEVAAQHHWYLLSFLAILSMTLSLGALTHLAYGLTGDFMKSQTIALSAKFSRRAVLLSLLVPLFLMMVFTDLVFQWTEQSLKLILW